MRNRTWALLIGLVLIAGCADIDRIRVKSTTPLALTPEEAQRMQAEAIKLGSAQPRSLAAMTKVAETLEPVARALPNDYDAQWQAAEALSFVAANDTRNDVRVQAAEFGLTIARHGQTLLPDRVECHYWYAINVGLLADADRSYGLKGVSEMETALKRAAELDARYDYAGPLRILGILHLRTPAPPVSIGSSRKGLRLLQRAAALFPDYPENWLYLAEAYRENNRPVEARELLQRVLAAKPWPDRQFESGSWKTDAEKMLKSLASK